MHYARVYLFIKRIIDEPDDAQDITAETFVKLWNLRANFETHQHIKAFLFTTARNACMDYLRSRQRQQTNKKEFSYFWVGYEDASFQQDEIKVEVLEQIHTEIENLPQQCKRIFKMAYFARKKNAQIAMELGLTEQTVRNQKSRAIKILRIALTGSQVILLVLLIQAAFIFLDVY
jgi:RNA polymerase sigma-70 factor (ECF subfamily)